jgi:hypothetical protein
MPSVIAIALCVLIAPRPGDCNNWTSSAATGVTAQVGHHNRAGGGVAPTSWNAAHATSGCSAAAFVSTGGRGSIYCFAAD